jgi:hypothetical protein
MIDHSGHSSRTKIAIGIGCTQSVRVHAAAGLVIHEERGLPHRLFISLVILERISQKLTGVIGFTRALFSVAPIVLVLRIERRLKTPNGLWITKKS